MSHLFRYLLCLLLFVTVQKTVDAQQYPVTSSTQIIPPYSVYLPDYAVPGSDKLRVILVQNDLTQPSYDVRLQMTVEQNGKLIMRTATTFNPRPLSLSAGIPTIIGGADLYDYLTPANIEFSGGFSRDEYERTKSLPEGAYRISFTAYDYRRPQVQVSNTGANVFFFQKSDPPLLNLPICGSRVEKQDPQFLTFNWSSRNSPNPLPGSGTEYVFSLYEIKPAGSTPDYIVRSARPIYTLTTETNTIVYGPGETLLIDSMQYVWTVQARDKSGRDLFSNQGLSLSCTFTYLSTNPFTLKNIEKPTLSGRSTGERSIRLNWTLAPTDAGYEVEAYRLQYRATKTGTTEFDWQTEEKKNDTAFTATSLEPGRSYEARLQWKVAGFYGPYSDLITITTDAAKTFVCGDIGSITQSSNTTPLATASIGNIVRAGNYDVLLTKVEGSNGKFTGKGRVITLGFGIGLLMEFKDVTINTDMVLIKGEMQAVTEGIDKFVNDALEEQRGGNDVGKVVTGDVVPDIKTKLHIFSAANIKVDTDAGTISITDTNGNVQEVINYADKGKTLPLVLEDADGNLYSIDKKGNVTSIGKRDSSLNAQALEALKTLNLDNGKITFTAGSGNNYAFDVWNDNYTGKTVLEKKYESLADGKYRVSAKAIVPGEQEVVVATLKDAVDITTSKVKFVTGKGIVLVSKDEGNNVFSVTVTGGPGGDAQEVYAVYPKTGGGYISMGKLLVASYTPMQKKVVLVPVLDTKVPSQTVIEKSLKAAYAKIGVSYTVEIDESFRKDTSWDKNGDKVLQDKGSAFLSSDFTGEEKAMKKAYKKHHSIDDNTVYLFVMNEAALTDGDLTGKMPRGSQFGFLFTKGVSDAVIGQTVAHEAGHGAYTLEHIFSSGIGLSKNSTENLMDHGSGYDLLKYQWDIVHDPGSVWGIFEGDEESESLLHSSINVFDTLRNKANNTYTFITPSGKYITLPATASNLTFSTLDRLFDVMKGDSAKEGASDDLPPLGALISFDNENKIYKAVFKGNVFNGYVSVANEKDVYIDIYTAGLKPSSGIAAFIAVKNKGFISYASRFKMNGVNEGIPEKYTGEGAIGQSFSVLDMETYPQDLSIEAILKKYKEGDYALITLPIDLLLFANDKIQFKYKDGDPVEIKEFLLDLLKEESSLSDYMFSLTLANLKENEMQGFADCLEARTMSGFEKLIDMMSNISKSSVPSQVISLRNLYSGVRKKTLEEFSRIAEKDLQLIKDLHAAVKDGKDAEYINSLFVKKGTYAICSLTGISYTDRKYILGQLLSKGYNDNYWYRDPKWYSSNDGECILRDLINTTPASDRVNLLKDGFMANRYEWLYTLWEAANKRLNGVGYDHMRDIFDIINPWIVENYANLDVKKTVKTFSNPLLGINNHVYQPLESAYLIGMDKDEVYTISKQYEYSTFGSDFTASDIKFKDDGKINFNQSYKLSDVSNIMYQQGKVPNRSAPVYFEEEFDPFEPIAIQVAAPYADNGFDAGDKFIVPAYMGMVFDKDLERTRVDRKIRKVTNVVTIGVGVAAALQTGGTSLALISNVVAEVGAVVAAADINVQAERNAITVAMYQQNREFYETWDKIKTVSDFAQLGVTGAGILSWGWTKFGSIQKLSNTLDAAKTSLKNIPASLKELTKAWTRVQNLTKGVVTEAKIPIGESKLFEGSGFSINSDGKLFERSATVVNNEGKLVDAAGSIEGFGSEFVNSRFGIGQVKGASSYDDIIEYSSKPLLTPKLPGGGVAGAVADVEVLTKAEAVNIVEELVQEGYLIKVNGNLKAYVKINTSSAGESILKSVTIVKYVVAGGTAEVKAPAVLVVTAPDTEPLVSYAIAEVCEKVIVRKKEKEKKDTCTICRKFTDDICRKFEELQKNTAVSQTTAINKLCANLSAAHVNNVLDYLLAMKISELNTLLGNVDGIPASESEDHLTNHISAIQTKILDAWELMRDVKGNNSNYLTNYPTLREIMIGRDDASFMRNVGNDDGFKEVLKANKGLPCSTCKVNNGYLNPAPDYIKDLTYFSKHFNFNGLWNDLKQQKAYRTVIGAAFQLRVLRERADLFPGDTTIVKFDASLDDTKDDGISDDEEPSEEATSKCRFDIRVRKGNTNYYYEFKCWSNNTFKIVTGIRSRRVGFANQLKSYLSKIDNLDQLNYVFDGKRMTEKEGRAVLQIVLVENVDNWYNETDGTISGEKLRHLFEVNDLSELKLKISNENNNIYKFVKAY
jgi:hypothetical protein